MANHALLILFVFLIGCGLLISIVVGARHPLHLPGSTTRKNEENGVSPLITILKYGAKILLQGSTFVDNPTTPGLIEDSNSDGDFSDYALDVPPYIECNEDQPCRDGTCDYIKRFNPNCICSRDHFGDNHPIGDHFCLDDGPILPTATVDYSSRSDEYTDEDDGSEETTDSESYSDDNQNVLHFVEDYFPGEQTFESMDMVSDSSDDDPNEIFIDNNFPGEVMVMSSDHEEMSSDDEGNSEDEANFPGDLMDLSLNNVDLPEDSEFEKGEDFGDGTEWTVNNGKWERLS